MSFDVSKASFTDSFDVSSQDSVQNTVVFSDSGDKMFTVGTLQNKVFEYSLSTSFDVSTASFTDSKDFSTQLTIPDLPTGLAFSSSGDKMFVLGDDNTAVYEYSLSTNFDVSTASFTSSFDVSNQDTNLKALTFSSSGDKMFVLGDDNTAVFEYSLSTNFDSDSASFTDSFDVSSQATFPTGVAFSSSGDKMFVVGSNSNNVNEYSLSTSFDVSTASFTDSFDVSSQDTVPTGVAFSGSGDKMFVLGDDNDNVNEYSIGQNGTPPEAGVLPYNKQKKLDVDSVSGTPTVEKATAIIISGGDDSKTGNGDIVIDFTNVSSESDLAVYDQNDSLLGYEIESFDASNEEAVLWVYDDWVRDGSTQAKVVYGNGPSSSEEGSASDVWGNTGQNAVMVQHLQDDPLNATDSSPNNNNGTVNGAVSTTLQFDGAASFDGSDDRIDSNISNISKPFTLVSYFNIDPSTPADNANPMISIADSSVGNQQHRVQYQTDSDKVELSSFDGTNNVVSVPNVSEGTDFLMVATVTSTGRALKIDETTNSNSETDSISNIDRATLGTTADASAFGFFQGVIDEARIYNDEKSSTWKQAEFDASPKGGQVFFSQQAAEAISESTVQTVSVPTSNGSATTVNPVVSPIGQATVNTVRSTATSQSLKPQLQPQTATVNTVTNTASTQSLSPQVTLQTAKIKIPVSTGTGNSINPAISGTGITSLQTSVNQAQTESLNPSVEPQTMTVATPVNTANAESTTPVVTTSLIVNVPTSTANASNPEPTVSKSFVRIQTSLNQVNTGTPSPDVDATGTASIQTLVNNLVADSISPATTSTGTTTIQADTNQATAQSINPDLVLFRELDFEAPTKAIINKPNRFVTMQSRTFKTNDLGDELTATLKDENGVLDLSQGVSSVTLLMRDLKGNKVLDQQVTITDGANGEIEYEWSSNDTPIQEPGAYQAEFEILDTRDNAETVPNDGFVTIETEDDING